MTARPVQISLDSALLSRIDADPEVHERGRSALIRSAVLLYLQAKKKQETESRLTQAYEGEADPLFSEIEGLMNGQSWPND